MNVSLRLLRVFLAVSREGNVGRAASSLLVSQPSLSQDIRRLERELGTQLFVRGAHGVTLTPAGEEFRRDVEDALALLDHAVEHAQAAAHSSRRRIVLGFTPSIGHELMPSLLSLLEARLPGVLLDEREVDTGEVAAGVRSGTFDIGLAHCQTAEAGLTTMTVRLDPLCVALSAEHPLAKRAGPVRLAEIGDLPLMLWSRDLAPQYHDRLVAICDEAGLSPRLVPGPRRAVIRSYALSDGSAFCLLPLSTSRLHVPGVSFLPVADEEALVSLEAVRRNRREGADVESVWQLLLAEAPRL